MFRNKEEHPSYGLLGFYRASSSSAHPLYGSSIQHRDTIHLRLRESSKSRELNRDFYFGDRILFDIEMSFSQFANLITSMNQGEGVPVTLRYVHGKPEIPNCPYEDKTEVHKAEFKQHLTKVYEESNNLIKIVEEKFKTKKSFTKKDQEEILGLLRSIKYDIGTNQSFQLSQFQEQMEQTVTESKGEIESFVQNKLFQIAQEELVERNILGHLPVELSHYIESEEGEANDDSV